MKNVILGKNCLTEGSILGKMPFRPGIFKTLEIGDNAVISQGTIIYQGSKIGDDFKTGHYTVIREEVEIGNNVSIWGGTTVDYGAKIGNNVKIHTNCYVAQYTTVEDGVFMAPGVIIGNDPHPGCEYGHECMKQYAAKIKKGAQIGLNVTILPGVTIGERSLIGAGAVVAKDVPAGSVVVGNPGRVVKKVEDIECPLEDKKGFKPYI